MWMGAAAMCVCAVAMCAFAAAMCIFAVAMCASLLRICVYDQLCCPASPKLLVGLDLGLGCDKN